MFANSVNHKPKIRTFFSMTQTPMVILPAPPLPCITTIAPLTSSSPDPSTARARESGGVTRDLVPWGKEDTTRCRGSSRRGGCKRRRAYISSPLRRRSGVRWTGLAVSYSRRLLYDGRLRAAGGERLLSLGHSSRSRRYAHTSTQQQKGQHVKRFYIALIKGLNATCVLK